MVPVVLHFSPDSNPSVVPTPQKLYQDWSLWPAEHGESVGMWLPRWVFPGGPVVKTCISTTEGVDSIPGWGTEILSAKKKKKKKFPRLGYERHKSQGAFLSEITLVDIYCHVTSNPRPISEEWGLLQVAIYAWKQVLPSFRRLQPPEGPWTRIT